MSEEKDLIIFEKRLKELKREEAMLMGVLHDVRRQLNRYKVEELHMNSISTRTDNPCNADSDSDQDLSNDEELKSLAARLDCANEINQSNLNLDIRKKLDEDFIDEEEFEDSN